MQSLKQRAKWPTTDDGKLQLLFDLLDKEVMSTEDMARALRENVKTPNYFNGLLKTFWRRTGEDVKSFFPVGGTLRINNRNFEKLKKIYNENSSLINAIYNE